MMFYSGMYSHNCVQFQVCMYPGGSTNISGGWNIKGKNLRVYTPTIAVLEPGLINNVGISSFLYWTW